MTFEYDLKYYEKMLRQNSKTAEKICNIRWKFVDEVLTKNDNVVLDYGSGVGWFKAFAPDKASVDTHDIGCFPQTGINRHEYDLITFFDVIEHIESFSDIKSIISRTKYVAATIPIVPKDKNLEDWKHFKPYEHLHYFNEKEFISLFKYIGFELIKKGTPECPPRKDVVSFLFKQKGIK